MPSKCSESILKYQCFFEGYCVVVIPLSLKTERAEEKITALLPLSGSDASFSWFWLAAWHFPCYSMHLEKCLSSIA